MKRCESCPDYQSDLYPHKSCKRCECGRWLVPVGLGTDLKPFWVCPKDKELAQEYSLG